LRGASAQTTRATRFARSVEKTAAWEGVAASPLQQASLAAAAYISNMVHQRLTVAAAVLLFAAGIRCVLGAGSRNLLAPQPEWCKSVDLNYGELEGVQMCVVNMMGYGL